MHPKMTPVAINRLNFAGFGLEDIVWAGQAPPLRPHLELEESSLGYALDAPMGEIEAHELRLRVASDFMELEGRHIEQRSWPRSVCFLPPAERELQFARRFPLGDADPRRVEARLVAGLLTLRVAKARPGSAPFVGVREVVVSGR
jgi:HSP20 family molecular chaperone IbpA